MKKDLPICIVEDNKPIRKLFSTILQKSGFQIVDFGEGTAALDWLNSNKPLAVIIDILLEDFNGTDILKRIRQNQSIASVPVIAITGFVATGDREKYLALGFDSYIPKPINTTTFVNEIEEAINNKND
jgi:two-component system, cell cycle response regulator DivK